MGQLIWYWNGKKAYTFPLPETGGVKTVGRTAKCTFPLDRDARVSKIHLLLRFSDGKYEICAVGPCRVENEVLAPDTWGQYDDRPIYITPASYLVVSPTADPPASFDFVEMESSRQNYLKKNLASITKSTVVDDRYRIQEQLGAGAMGEIYLAWDSQLQRKIALKLLQDEYMSDDVARKRFLKEAQAIGKLRHQNIVMVHDVGEFNGTPYFTMELLEGDDLQELMKKETVNPLKAMGWIRDIARAVAYAHSNNIIHRDIKPSNIFITPNGPILTDFGIAKDSAGKTHLTIEGESLGTPAYMPPEQALGYWDKVNETSDIYGLGAVLYEVLSGSPPFSSDSAVKVLEQVCSVAPIPISRLNPDVSRNSVVITMKAMAKQQRYRYQTADEMADDIERHLKGKSIEGKLPPFHAKMIWLVQKNKAVSFVATCSVLFLLLFLSWHFYSNYKKQTEQEKLVDSYLKDAQRMEESHDNQTPLGELFRVFNLYGRTLSLDSGNREAKEGKLKVCLMMGDSALRSRNFEFAKAMFFLSEQISKELEDPHTTSLVTAKQEELSHLETRENNYLREKAEEIIDTLKEPDITNEQIKEVALNLLRFPTVLNSIRISYRQEKNENIQKALALTARCLLNNRSLKSIKITELNEIENRMVKLMPYNSPILQEALNENFESPSSKIRILVVRLCGIFKYHDSVPLLLKRVLYDDVSEVRYYALQSVLSLDGGREAVVKDFSEGKLSVEHLKNLGYWGIDLLLDLLKEKPLQYQESFSPIFKKIGRVAVHPILDSISDGSRETKLALLMIAGQFPHPKVQETLQKYSSYFVPEIRLVALRSLSNFPKDQVLSDFTRALLDSDIAVQEVAISSLGKLQALSLCPKVLKLVDRKPQLEKVAEEAFLKMGSDAVPYLIEHLEKSFKKLFTLKMLGKLKAKEGSSILLDYFFEGKKKEQEVARYALVQIGPSVSDDLRRRYPSVTDPEIKENILFVLGMNKDRKSLNLFLKANDDPQLRPQAIQSLALLGEPALNPLIKKLKNEVDLAKALGFAKALGSMGKVALKPVVKEFTEASYVEKERIALALAEFGNIAAPALLDLAKNKDSYIRLKAIQSMANLKTEESTLLLLRALDDSDFQIKKEAEDVLKKMGPFVVPTILEQLEKSKGREQTSLLKILGEMRDERTIDLFFELLKDIKRVDTAAFALKKIAEEHPQVVLRLIENLDNPELEEGAERTLRYLGRDILEVLKEKFEDREYFERRELSHRLARLIGYQRGRENIVFLLDMMVQGRDEEIQNIAKESILRMKSSALDPYFKAFVEDGKYRHHAGDIVEANGRKSVSWLIKLLREERQLANDVFRLFVRLDSAGHSSLIQLLRDRDPFIQENAARLLGQMKVRRAIFALERASRDDDPRVSKRAEDALREIKKAHGIK